MANVAAPDTRGWQDPRLLTLVLWIAAMLAPVAALAAAFAVHSSETPVLSFPSWESRREFNLLAVILVPYAAAAISLLGVALWAVRRWIARQWFAIAATASLVVAALAVLGPFISPMTVLLYQLPVLATGVYAALGRRHTLLRILGVGVFALAIGVAVYAFMWGLVGGETD